MKTRKIFGVVVVSAVLLLGGLSFALAAVTAPIKVPELAMELAVRQGTVELQPSGSLDWSVVTGVVPVSMGDTIRTGDQSDASVNLYNQGVLHIAENSTVALTEMLWDTEQPDILRGDVLLEAGGLWSRLFDFVSPDSAFDVRTSSTVATVRGTTFWVETGAQDATRVYVDDHAVAVSSLTNNQVDLEITTGEMAQLKNPRAPQLGYVQPTEADRALIEKYRRWDDEYETEIFERRYEFAKKVRRFDPDSSLYTFQRLAERVRLALASGEREEALRARFMTGRLLDAYIEMFENNNRTRARIFLSQAQAFQDESSFRYPEVRHAALFFGHDLKLTSVEHELLQLVPEESSGAVQTDTQFTPEPVFDLKLMPTRKDQSTRQ